MIGLHRVLKRRGSSHFHRPAPPLMRKRSISARRPSAITPRGVTAHQDYQRPWRHSRTVASAVGSRGVCGGRNDDQARYPMPPSPRGRRRHLLRGTRRTTKPWCVIHASGDGPRAHTTTSVDRWRSSAPCAVAHHGVRSAPLVCPTGAAISYCAEMSFRRAAQRWRSDTYSHRLDEMHNRDVRPCRSHRRCAHKEDVRDHCKRKPVPRHRPKASRRVWWLARRSRWACAGGVRFSGALRYAGF